MADPYFQSPLIQVSLQLASSLLKSEYPLLKGMKKDISRLEVCLTTIQDVVEDAEEKQLDDPDIRDWLGRVTKAVYDAEDILKSLETEACLWQLNHQSSNQHPKGSTELKGVLARLDGMAKENTFASIKAYVIGRTTRKSDEAWHTEFCSIIENLPYANREFCSIIGLENLLMAIGMGRTTRESDGAGLSEVRGREDAPSLIETDVLGRENDREKIIEILLSPKLDREEDVPVLPIYGRCGLGKTALAQLVYNDHRVEENFDLRMWVCVTENYDYRRILEEMIEYCSTTEYDIPTLSGSQLETRLLHLLSKRKFFLVLDDVWNVSPYNWRELQDLLRQGAKGSRVMITTQSTEVSTVSSSSRPYRLDFLPEDKCWLLFERNAFKKHIYTDEKLHRELEIIGREIVSKIVNHWLFKGLPLAIKILGFALRGETDVRKWQKILEKLDELIIPHPLKLSYDRLPLHLKRCFSYCSLFPKSHIFYKNEIVKLWLAQSFIQPDGTGDALDVIGIRYFDELSTKSFFQTIHGNNTGYKMHNLLHDLANYVSCHQCCQIDGQDCHISQSTRHVTLVCGDVKEAVLKLSVKAPKLRTLIMLNSEYVFRVESLEKIFRAFKYLRTLDLSSTLLTELPSSVEKLKLLHHLDLSRTKIQKLPNSICNLYNLLTLKLLECHSLITLPHDLLKLVNLKNLELDDNFWVKLFASSLTMEDLLINQKLQIHSYSNKRYIPQIFTDINKGPDSMDMPSSKTPHDQVLKSLMSKFEKLSKRKDLWHFFKSSYPMNQMPDLYNFDDLKIIACSNCILTTCKALFHDKNYQVNQEYMTSLAKYCHHLETTANLNAFPREIQPYLPKGWTFENGQLNFYAPSDQVTSFNVIPNWAIESAISQASHFLTSGLGRLVAISGQDAEKVANRLALEQDIVNKFKPVLSLSLSQFGSNEEVQKGIQKKCNEILGASMSYEESLKSFNFLLILVGIDESYFDLYKLKIPIYHGSIVLTTQSDDIYHKVAVDMEIKMEYHLLPWDLFQRLVNQDFHMSSPFYKIATSLVPQCFGNLLAIILLARALKGVEVNVWEHARNELMLHDSPLTEEAATNVLIRVIRFIWKQKNLTTQRCIQHYVANGTDRKINLESVVSRWNLYCLVKTEEEGYEVARDLTSSFSIDNSRGGLQMQEKVRTVISEWILPHCGSEKLGKPIIESDNSIKLQNTELNELLGSPSFYQLKKLIVNGSNLMKIAPPFFNDMPILQVLDLSRTSIMALPSTISNLVSLEKLILRCCELLMELPPEIGELKLLKVLDASGTEIMYIPEEIKNLTSLEELKLSLYGHGERFREEKGIRRIYPRGAFSKLSNLKELSIDVNPLLHEQWNDEILDIISDLKRINIKRLELYLPEAKILRLTIPPSFKFIIGWYKERMIYRVLHDVEERFKAKDKSLRYINGYTITYLTETLRLTRAFFLERHWAIKSISKVGTANLANLEFLFVVECNKLETILDEFQEEDLQYNGRLGSLEYLGLYFLRNLTSICRGQVGMGTLSKLKHLSLRTCTSVSHVFTFELIKNLENLEELLLEDCPKIQSLVTDESPSTTRGPYLPRLKKLSLLGLPEMVSIANGLCIAPELERLVIFYCPKLEIISTNEISLKHLKVLKGENEWWESLNWDKWGINDQYYLAELFVPIKRDGTLNAQLTGDGF